MGKKLTFYLPCLSCLCLIFYTTLAFNDIVVDDLNFIGGNSLCTSLYFLVQSYHYKLCKHHRVPIYYLIILSLFNIVDNHIVIKLSYFYYMVMLYIGFGLCVFLMCAFKVQDNKEVKKLKFLIIELKRALNKKGST